MKFKQHIYGRRKIISWKKDRKQHGSLKKYTELDNDPDMLQADDLASGSSASSEESSSDHDKNEEEGKETISYDTETEDEKGNKEENQKELIAEMMKNHHVYQW